MAHTLGNVMAEAGTGRASGGDVVDVLIAQHGLIRDLFAEVKTSTGDDQVEAFHRLRYMLAVHETAEEELVHPAARQAVAGGDDGLVDDRLAEEKAAKQALSRLEELRPGEPEFLELGRAAPRRSRTRARRGAVPVHAAARGARRPAGRARPDT